MQAQLSAINAHGCNGESQDVYILKLKLQVWSHECRGCGDFTGSADFLLTVGEVLPLRILLTGDKLCVNHAACGR